MDDEPRRCAHRAPATGRPACTRLAVYRVGRPTRRNDDRDTCRTHLAATVDALAQGDASILLTISYIGEADDARP